MRHSAGRPVKTAHRIVRNTLVIDLGAVHRVLSSAPRRGGLVKARSILNHQVAATGVWSPSSRFAWDLTPCSGDPARYLGSLAAELGAEPPCVGLMTAVPVKQVVGLREESNGMWVECFCTVGVTNAVRAGEPASYKKWSGRRCCEAGTINIILVTNATLSVPAMVGAVQVATESKTAALLDRAVPSGSGRGLATGTGTDAVVVACRLRGGPRIQYSGTHTELGAMIGRLVGRCVRAGLSRAARWEHRNKAKR